MTPYFLTPFTTINDTLILLSQYPFWRHNIIRFTARAPEAAWTRRHGPSWGLMNQLASVHRSSLDEPGSSNYSKNRPAPRPYIIPQTGIVVVILVLIFWGTRYRKRRKVGKNPKKKHFKILWLNHIKVSFALRGFYIFKLFSIWDYTHGTLSKMGKFLLYNIVERYWSKNRYIKKRFPKSHLA